MKRWNHVMLVLCLAATATACAGDRAANDRSDDAAVGTSGREGEAARTGESGRAAEPGRTAEPGLAENRAGGETAARADREFIGHMMADSESEIMLGKLAQQKARNARVKEFAGMIVRDHTAAGKELKSLAGQARADAAGAEPMIEDHRDLRNRLAKLSGAEFDRAYMEAMVENHEKAVSQVEDQVEDAENTQIKGWATKTLPKLKQHLERAKEIQASLEGGSRTRG